MDQTVRIGPRFPGPIGFGPWIPDVGYSKESDAAKALKKLNGTTLGISKELFLSKITRLNSGFFLDFRTQGMELESE